MIKKLHVRLIKAFAGPFLASFAITMFLFLMHFIWLYIDDLVGKGLSTWLIIKLLSLTSATLVPMALPLAVLLSSLMAYGNLAEHFEIVAIKASGISLIKTLLPNFVIIILLSFATFFFVNKVIPKAMLESRSLLWDVRQKKPAFNIEDGIFYDKIDGYSIKIGKKEEDNETIHDIIIYEQSNTSEQLNVIKAKKGRMYLSDNERLLYFNLEDGVRYQEMTDEVNYYKNYPTNITAFKKQEITFDLSALDMKNTEKELFMGDHRMMTLKGLQDQRDSARKDIRKRNRFQLQYLRTYYKSQDTFTKVDTTLLKKKKSKLNLAQRVNSSISVSNMDTSDIVVSEKYSSGLKTMKFDTTNRLQLLYTLENTLGMQVDVCKNTIESNKSLEYNALLYTTEMNKKITLPVLIIILFFIAAPLGTIIRKGGLGMPLVISVVMFIIYYVISLTGEKLAKEGIWNLYAGMWLANIVFLPIAIFITYKASLDSGLFDIDVYKKVFRFVKSKLSFAKNSTHK